MDAFSSTLRSPFKPGAGYSKVPATPSASTSPVQSPARRNDTPGSTANLRRIHEESTESSLVTSTPDETFHRKEQSALQRQQIKIKDFAVADILNRRTSPNQSEILAAGKVQTLSECTSDAVVITMESPTNHDPSKALHNGVLKAAQGEEATVDGTSVQRNSRTESDSSEIVQRDDVSSSLDELGHAKKALLELQSRRAALARSASAIDGADSDEESAPGHDSALLGLDRQIALTKTLIHRLEALVAKVDQGDTQAPRHHNLSSLVRTATKYRFERPATRETASRLQSNDTRANLRILHEHSENLTLSLPEDRLTDQTGNRQRIETLRATMEEHAARGDEAFTRYRKLSHAIIKDVASGDVGPKTLAAKEKRLQQYEAEWLQHMSQLMPLLDEWETLVGADPVGGKSAQQLASERKAVVERCKSLQTVVLEKNYLDKLAKQQERVGDTNAYVLGWDALTGSVGFSVSFLIGNTLGRYLPQPANTYAPPLVSGLLHTIAATPVAKNLMARTWTATSLAELNNYFKLAGAHAGAWIAGTTEQRKYDPKDPAKEGKLTIAEKRAEETKSFHELSHNRYRDEEAAYWFYTFNYSIKAAACSVVAQFLSQGTEAARGTEAALHAWSGACSGAEYIMTQQVARSARPNAKPVAVPTRDIFTAQAVYLKSLRDDVNTVLTGTRTVPAVDLTNANMRVLRRESHRLEQERIIAERKSQWAGIARHEFVAQFQGDAKWDTLSEALGRIITLVPVTVVNEMCAHMRKSPDSLTMFLGHFLPSVVLIGGFTTRPWVCGTIRAGIQAFLTSRESSGAQPSQTVATAIPSGVAQTSASSEAAGSDETLAAQASSDSQLASASSHRKTDNGRSSDDFSIDIPSESSIVEASEEVWTGNATERDLNAAN